MKFLSELTENEIIELNKFYEKIDLDSTLSTFESYKPSLNLIKFVIKSNISVLNLHNINKMTTDLWEKSLELFESEKHNLICLKLSEINEENLLQILKLKSKIKYLQLNPHNESDNRKFFKSADLNFMKSGKVLAALNDLCKTNFYIGEILIGRNRQFNSSKNLKNENFCWENYSEKNKELKKVLNKLNSRKNKIIFWKNLISSSELVEFKRMKILVWGHEGCGETNFLKNLLNLKFNNSEKKLKNKDVNLNIIKSEIKLNSWKPLIQSSRLENDFKKFKNNQYFGDQLSSYEICCS